MEFHVDETFLTQSHPWKQSHPMKLSRSLSSSRQQSWWFMKLCMKSPSGLSWVILISLANMYSFCTLPWSQSYHEIRDYVSFNGVSWTVLCHEIVGMIIVKRVKRTSSTIKSHGTQWHWYWENSFIIESIVAPCCSMLITLYILQLQS